MPHEKLIRVELGDADIPQPCEAHKKRGYQADCEDCEATDPVPGEIPDLKGFFVEIRNPNVLPYGETKDLFAPREGETGVDYRERVAVALITAWNVRDAETDEELLIPSQDPGALNRAVDVVTPVFAAALKARRERAVPKASTT